jgi:hypothetical protein
VSPVHIADDLAGLEGELGPFELQAGAPRHPEENVHSGQLDWLPIGCERAAACGADPAMVVNALPMDGLLAWISAK